MKSATYYAAYLLKKLWTLAAILLVVVAVSISILRFSLPYMDEQKHRVESWINEQYGVQLEIGELNADWRKNGPSLVLKDVVLMQNEQSPIGLEINETQIEIDFWNTILARQVQSQRFELNGLALSVNLARIQTAESEFPIVEALENLFLEQLHRFSVRNSVVDVVTRYDQQLIQIQQLSWVNKENRHQGTGQLRVVELANNSATFTLDLYGGKDNLVGTFYARGEELDLSPWLNQLVRTQNQLTQSRGNFTFWASINNSQVENVQIQLQKSEFAWTTPDTQVEAAIIGGNIRAMPDNFGWRVNVDDLTLESQEQSLVTSWMGHIGRNGETRFSNVNPVNMRAILPVLPLVFDKKSMEFVDRLAPEARLDNLAVSIGKEFLASVNFSKVSWNQVDSLPGITDLQGQFFKHDNFASLRIRGEEGTIQADNVLDDNLAYETLQLDANFLWHGRGVLVEVPKLHLHGEALSMTQEFSFDTKDNRLALFSDIQGMDIQKVKALLPNQYLDADTKNYLSGALESGTVAQAQLLWQGEVSDFPFDGNRGVFQAKVDLDDMTLKFSPGWPALTELDIDLLFENAGLFMTAESGKLKDVELAKLSAQIPKLSQGAVLTIQATTEAQSQQARALIDDSELANTLGVALHKGINLNGQMAVELDLTIPFSDQPAMARGAVVLAGNTMLVPSLGTRFENLNGRVTFANDVVKVDDLKGELFAQEVSIGFSSQSDPSGAYLADIRLAGDWAAQPLLETYQPGMQVYIEGSTKWQANTKLTLNGEAYAYSFELSSDLQGIASDLPAPFAKEKRDKTLLLVSGSGQNQASNFNLALGEQVSFEGVLPHDTMQFSRAHLAIGDEEVVSMGLGFSISASTEFLDFDAWYEALSVLLADLPSSQNAILSEPQRVYVNAGTMLIAGQKIEDLELVAKHSTDDWLLEFNAEQIRAEVMLYDDWLNRGIEVNADFIKLAQWEGEQSAGYKQPLLNNLPPVKFECKRCQLFGKDLGRVDFSLSRAPQGMQIDNLRFNNDNGILYATGFWGLSEEGAQTQLTGELSSPDFGALLKGFGLDSGIKDSKASFNFDVTWDDSPHKFSLASLNGDVDWRLTDGYLSEVSDKGARIFSILSLQSLIRKLSLDFRDVFAKGFFYDKMRGSFQIVNGRADTRDTVIDGAAGEMLISGYSDLATRDMNYLIEFTPNVTSSLPLLVYWMVNPATAIAALAIDQVLTEAKVISNVRYSVTGTLDEPILTELDRKSKDVTLPARTTPTPEQDSSDVPVELSDELLDIEIREEDDSSG